MEEEEKHPCAQCHDGVRLGVNAWQLAEGVIGPRGFVPLEDPLILCSDDCVRRYFKEHPAYTMQRRIP